MLRKRIIAVLLVRSGRVVQSIGFNRYLPVGKPKIALEFLNQWGVDEIVYHDTEATSNASRPASTLHAVAGKCFVPLTYGGGLTKTDDMVQAIRDGADKLSVNTAAYSNPELIEKGAEILGNQCIIASIDFHKDKSGNRIAYSHSGKKKQSVDLVRWAKEMESRGAGEIMINSIDRDGSKSGYDLDALESVATNVSVPVICCGGVGTVEHFAEGFEHGAAACAAANFFHFTEHNVNLTKAFLERRNSEVRLETSANYRKNRLGEDGRLLRKSDDDLENLRFKQIREEEI